MMEDTTSQALKDRYEGSVCCHHWIIDEPSGPISEGVCRRCSAVKKFKNFVEQTSWADEPMAPPGEPLDGS